MANRGGTKDLNEGRRQALQGLISSLSENSGANSNENLTPEQVDRLSEKLEQILGNGSIGGQGSSTSAKLQRNEDGQLLNEEGLPIIEITEPVEPSPSTPQSRSAPVYEIHDHESISIASLAADQKETLRIQRDKILDALEREEELEKEKEAEKERIELEKRREAAKSEVDRLRAAREMQKKMGKALLRNIADAREREEQQRREASSASQLHAGSSNSGERSLKPKKSVTFAEPPKDGEEDKPNLQKMEKKMRWGDVSAGPMNGDSRQHLRNKTDMGKQPMRLEVVERIPGQPSELTPEEHLPDSDDESIIDDIPSRSHIPPWLREDDAPFSPHRFSDEDDESTPDSDEQDVDSEDDVDFDTVEHQRQIFLEYNRLRGTIGDEVAKAMSSHTHEEIGEDEWDQPDVPLEATLASKPPRPSMSYFKASRISGRSTSLGGAPILPASQASSLKRAVQMGKVENGHLIGGEDSPDEDDGNDSQRKEFLDMLKRGEVRNAGPTGNGVDVTAPIIERNTSSTCSSKPDYSQTQIPGPVPQKPSRFRQEKSSGSNLSTILPVRDRDQSATPLRSEIRSSPKLSSPTPVGQVRERPAAKPQPNGFHGAPAVIPIPAVKSIAGSKLPVGEKPTVMPSMVVESPSFPSSVIKAPPSSPLPPSSTTPSQKQSPLTTEVTERSSNKSTAGSLSAQRPDVAAPARVSRFKSERMQI